MPSCRLYHALLGALAWAALGFQAEAALLREGSIAGVSTSSFEEYIRLHGRGYRPGSEEFGRRRALFEGVLGEVRRQNSRPGRLWSAELNKLSDQTEGELAALRGYSRGARPEGAIAGVTSRSKAQFLGKTSRSLDLDAFPEDFTWKAKLKATSEVQDQKFCGSCWAFSSATVLRAHSELYQQDRPFSVQQIVSCTPNPQKCGGDGGCQGATAELAMDYVTRNGCVTSADWAYTSSDSRQRCPAPEASLTAERITVADASRIASGLQRALGMQSADATSGLSFGMQGYTKLPENRLAPVMAALVDRGPVAVSVSAGAVWNIYSSGIMDLCMRNAVIDHAVTLVGFGVGKEGAEQGHKYWQIQNSWGPSWGEGGYIRISRKDNLAESRHCGTDRKPELGSGCRGGPSQVLVCGSCGILYDAVVPDFRLATDGLWSNRSFVEEHHRSVSRKASSQSV